MYALLTDGSTAAIRPAGPEDFGATPLVTRQALFQQADVIAVPGLGELTGTAALLATQPYGISDHPVAVCRRRRAG